MKAEEAAANREKIMERKEIRGVITAREEFLYPDSELGEVPEQIRLAMPLNGMPGIQLLFQTAGTEGELTLEGDGFEAEWYEMKPVPVEYNTGDGISQGGAMVLETGAEKPEYASKKAPFRVYDCLCRRQDGKIPVKEGRCAVYLCLKGLPQLEPGCHRLRLQGVFWEGNCTCILEIQVYKVRIPEDAFWVTNWFSREAICRFHQVEEGTQGFLEMLGKYGAAMRRMHQNIFFITLDDRCMVSKSPWKFDFEYLTPMIQCFFDAGMKRMELGTLLHRGFLENGEPNMYTDSFVCSLETGLKFDTLEGYAHTVELVKSLAKYLRFHGWEKQVLFHIHDEPDIHYKKPEDLEARRREYYLAASILRKYLPGVSVIEAVESAGFYGGVDVWVPGTAGYEARKEEFDRLIRLGEQVWTYVCCSPEGWWLNRFLDFPLIRGRLLFWGCAKNRIQGFLHWGFNQFPEGMDPFRGTSCPNDTGIGTNFPCGDSFLVYPGPGGPEIGMRLEAQRRGAEDAALWGLLRENEEALHDRLLGEVFVNNHTYCQDPQKLEEVYERLLKELESC